MAAAVMSYAMLYSFWHFFLTLGTPEIRHGCDKVAIDALDWFEHKTEAKFPHSTKWLRVGEKQRPHTAQSPCENDARRRI